MLHLSRFFAVAATLFLLFTPQVALAQDSSAPVEGRAAPALQLGALPEPFQSDDEDLKIVDAYFAMDIAANGAIVGFGVGAIVGGVESFILAAGSAGPSAQQYVFTGLTLASLGAASLISGIPGIDGSARSWKSKRNDFWVAGQAGRSMHRKREMARLKRRVRSHAMGIAADSAFMGLGIVMAVLAPSPLSTPLIVNGAFVLGLDIFQLVLDDQTARRWARRNEAATGGYFSARPGTIRPRILGASFSPMHLDRGDDLADAGLALSVVGCF